MSTCAFASLEYLLYWIFLSYLYPTVYKFGPPKIKTALVTSQTQTACLCTPTTWLKIPYLALPALHFCCGTPSLAPFSLLHAIPSCKISRTPFCAQNYIFTHQQYAQYCKPRGLTTFVLESPFKNYLCMQTQSKKEIVSCISYVLDSSTSLMQKPETEWDISSYESFLIIPSRMPVIKYNCSITGI